MHYLPWLKIEHLARDVVFIRRDVASFCEARALAGLGGIFNATGLGAHDIAVLEDQNAYFIRGQPGDHYGQSEGPRV